MSSDSRDTAASFATSTLKSERGLPVPHGPEKRLFDGVRTWTDVFPWLRLVRVCRVAGGPVWITHMLVVALVWCGGINWLGGENFTANFEWPVITTGSLDRTGAVRPVDTTMTPLGTTIGSNTWTPRQLSWVGLVSDWRMMLWSVLVWTPNLMALVRAGALLTAGRDMPSYVTTFRAVVGRLRSALVIVLLPMVIAIFLWLVAWICTWLAVAVGGASEHSTWATWLSLPVVLPATLIAGLLMFAGRLAVPLGLTAVMIEPDADPIDALSRGYEYTFRRLPQLVLLMLNAALISLVVVLAWAGIALTTRGIAMSVAPINPPLLYCLAILPSVIAVMLLWSMLGGIYLLLRQSAGGQEVEDLAIDSGHWKSPPMPSVQNR